MRTGERQEPALVLIFTLLTCGIYYFFWVYRVSGETQDYLDDPDLSPGMEVLLTLLTCGIYNVFWDYKMAKKIARMQERAGLRPVDNALLYVILDLCGLGIVNSLIEQSHLNEVWNATMVSRSY